MLRDRIFLKNNGVRNDYMSLRTLFILKGRDENG